MPTKLTTEIFIQRAREVHGDKYDYSKVIYKNAKSKVTIVCPIHNDFLQTPESHINQKHNCCKCARMLEGMKKRHTIKTFIDKSRQLHNNKYDYSKVVYKTCETNVIIICPVHGEFLQTPYNHLHKKYGCQKCGGTEKITTNEFIQRSKEVHGNKYDYSKVVYVKAKEKVIIICPIHGEFLQTPESHVFRKCGCISCSGMKKHTNESFIKKAIQIHGCKYNYDKVDYTNAITKVIIICKKHGEFKQTPNLHLTHHGCQKCGGSKKPSQKEFIKNAKKIHGNKYNYDKINYINAHTKISIICKKHGVFFQTPHAHINKQTGCPSCKKSNGENKIGKILKQNKIKHVRQKIFSDCINPKTKHWLSYDYYLPQQKILIEYNGMQHYKDIKYWHNSKHTFASQQYRDKIKEEYAISHGYKFLVIKYDNKDIEKTLIDFINQKTPTSKVS